MTEIAVEQDLLDDNDQAAAKNREIFRRAGVYVLNLMSGAGAGKTSLLERTLDLLRERLRLAVVVGDIETRRDADRLARHGVPAIQVNTAGACHIEARIIQNAVRDLDLEALDLLFIENVGNLVCPAEFDLGEHDKAMILSVTEGHDKPAKYPLMFHESRVLLLNKIDLLPHTDFDVEAAVRDARALNPELEVIRTSARTGEGLDAWTRWLEGRVQASREKRS
jgi:hydrogenase nickel incorporation protein HypB